MSSPNEAPSLANLPQVSGLQVVVRQETPFLPKVAFALITLASLAGATLTGTLAGLTGFGLVARWLSLWAVGLAGGFAVWRVFYLRDFDPEAAQDAVTALNTTALARAARVGRVLALIVLLGVTGPLATTYLTPQPLLRWGLVVLLVGLATCLLAGIDRRPAGLAATLFSFGAVAAWAYADAGMGWQGWVRLGHLSAFTLWLGGAVWNIWVAMPAGRQHPNVDAVLAGAHQLDRFRWVVRFALPTIIITGLIMAGVYRLLPLDWWLGFPGVLIPGKVLAIIALVVVFITCPLFRHCSPVQGVCNVDDLQEERADVAH
ncbi:MAG: hypothetical protein QM286_03155 [Acidobacteriota bacterium]|nr:hypothetical protein [Acidobacteriota bacterium]